MKHGVPLSCKKWLSAEQEKQKDECIDCWTILQSAFAKSNGSPSFSARVKSGAAESREPGLLFFSLSVDRWVKVCRSFWTLQDKKGAMPTRETDDPRRERV
jgi:hypothetical protein